MSEELDNNLMENNYIVSSKANYEWLMESKEQLETMLLVSIPGMAESIIEGGKTPLEECLAEDAVDWL